MYIKLGVITVMSHYSERSILKYDRVPAVGPPAVIQAFNRPATVAKSQEAGHVESWYDGVILLAEDDWGSNEIETDIVRHCFENMLTSSLI